MILTMVYNTAVLIYEIQPAPAFLFLGNWCAVLYFMASSKFNAQHNCYDRRACKSSATPLLRNSAPHTESVFQQKQKISKCRDADAGMVLVKSLDSSSAGAPRRAKLLWRRSAVTMYGSTNRFSSS